MIKIKTKEQIDGIRRAGTIAANCLKLLDNYVSQGITTKELNDIAAQYIKEQGGISACLGYKGYPLETCISINEIICHGIPDNRKLVEGDILNIDVTVKKDGYYGDTSKMFSVGNISAKANKLIQVTKKCLEKGLKEVYPGNYFGNIGYEISMYAIPNGYSVVYQFCGHGTGLEFHEEPKINHIADKNTGEIMKPGMVFTVEPMINIGKPEALINESDGWTVTTLDNSLSAQFEHTVVVTEDGYEILTLPS